MRANQTQPSWDTPASALLLFALLFGAGRLAVTDWVPHLTYAVPLVLMGGLLGLALGASRFGPRLVTLLALGYTVIILPWQLSLIIEGTIDWNERLASLGGRILASLALLIRDRQVDDYVLFLGLMCLLFWVLAIFSGYALSGHHDVLGALFPAGLAIVVISVYDFYAVSRMAYLAVYLFLGLAVLGRMNYLQSRRDWSARHVYLSPDAPTDLSMSIVVSAALIMVVAWSLPMTVKEYRSAAQFWSDAAKPLRGVREKLRDAFAAVRQPVPVAARDYYGDNLSLGPGSKHSDAVLFTVKAPPEALNMPRLYWRGVAYDHYQNGKWESSAPDTAKFSPQDQFLPLAGYAAQPAPRYTFTRNLGGHLLYTPANSVWVSRAATVLYFPANVGEMDVETLEARNLFLRGEVYEARAPAHNPTLSDLRNSGTNYPDWVAQTYLQLPEDFSHRVRQLAEQITLDQPNSYEKAAAITDYLRREMKYSERISTAPAGSDPIEWFLFEGKEGFCNYYASAEVLMLRSVGIPARLVAGFSQGEKSETGTIFTVRDSNAHAWPEVYFPGLGWVEFEPTANQDPLARPVGISAIAGNSATPGALAPEARRTEPPDLQISLGRPTPVGPRISTIALWFVISVLAVVLFLWVRRGRFSRPRLVRQASVGLRDFLSAHNLPSPAWLDRWVLWLQMSPIEQSFHAVNQGLNWLGSPQPIYATPAERAAALRQILPEVDPDIQSLVTELHAYLFSSRAGDTGKALQAARRVRRQALRRRLSRLFSRNRK